MTGRNCLCGTDMLVVLSCCSPGICSFVIVGFEEGGRVGGTGSVMTEGIIDLFTLLSWTVTE
jgi:hypothetical protein